MTLTIVCDEWTGGHAIYIDGILRSELDELDGRSLFECWQQFAGEPVSIEYVEIDSQRLGIWEVEEEDFVSWPEQLGELLTESTEE